MKVAGHDKRTEECNLKINEEDCSGYSSKPSLKSVSFKISWRVNTACIDYTIYTKCVLRFEGILQ